MDNEMRPGGVEITKYAFKACNLPKSAKILDIGCGNGDTANFLKSEYGFSVTGMDNSDEAISEAKKKYPGIEFIEGDGQWLNFDSFTFDGILMECSLSLMSNPVEAIHEAYCALKKGGYLIVHDLYLPYPSNDDYEVLEHIKKQKLEHASKPIPEQNHRSRPEECQSECQTGDESCSGSCELSQQYAESNCPEEILSPCTVDGALVMDVIFAALNELELEKVLFEDRKADLDSYAASMIFNGNDTKCYDKLRQGKSKISYFLLIARKAGKVEQ